MAALIALDKIQVPAHLQNRAAANTSFLAGLATAASFPMIGLKGTRFAIRADGGETVLPSAEISVIMLGARPNLNKAFYASKFDPSNTEAKAPDCFSNDGVRPDSSATLKQAESCAGCPMNQFGSGTDNQGNPSKGKACSDTKLLALFANNGVYGFKVPPASLKAFTYYVKETTRRGIDLSTAITAIGFDTNFTYPVLTFNFAGFLAPEQVAKIDGFIGSPEVLEIIGGSAQPAQVSPAIAAAPATPATPPTPPPAADPFAAAVAVEPVKEEKKTRTPKPKPAELAVELDNEDDLTAAAIALGLDLGL